MRLQRCPLLEVRHALCTPLPQKPELLQRCQLEVRRALRPPGPQEPIAISKTLKCERKSFSCNLKLNIYIKTVIVGEMQELQLRFQKCPLLEVRALCCTPLPQVAQLLQRCPLLLEVRALCCTPLPQEPQLLQRCPLLEARALCCTPLPQEPQLLQRCQLVEVRQALCCTPLPQEPILISQTLNASGNRFVLLSFEEG